MVKKIQLEFLANLAQMAELADAWDLRSHGVIRAGSTPALGTIQLVP